jgi:hypothetical protein
MSKQSRLESYDPRSGVSLFDHFFGPKAPPPPVDLARIPIRIGDRVVYGALDPKTGHVVVPTFDAPLTRGLVVTDTHWKVLEMVLAERTRQDTKHGDQSHVSPEFFYMVLGEEVGEIANARLEQDRDNYLKEIVQVATVAFRQVEYILEGRAPW